MKELKQFYFHRPERGEIGDCWRTCIACLLNADSPASVPHYLWDMFSLDDDNWQHVLAKQNEWLSSKGLRFVEYPVTAGSLEGLRAYLAHYYKDMYVMVGCNSKHGGHEVIMKNGDYMWDPSKDDSGCVGPMNDGYYWIGNLIKL